MVSTDTSNEGKAGILKCKPAFKVDFKREKLPTTGTCSFSLIAGTSQDSDERRISLKWGV